jgi:hypothetical protein
LYGSVATAEVCAETGLGIIDKPSNEAHRKGLASVLLMLRLSILRFLLESCGGDGKKRVELKY